MSADQTAHLPIHDVLPALKEALRGSTNVVLTAEPGAGKTTAVPPALLDAPWLEGKKIIMLEPRRLAAVRSAEYIARQLGESAGKTAGYRIRGENVVSAATRIEIVTEGILTRMLQSDPELPGVGLVIFDEFHERSIHADLGLALLLDVQQSLRPDLRILVMSATIDATAVASLMGGAPVIAGKGRAYPVEIRYIPPIASMPVEQSVASAVFRAVKEDDGDILVFLPGQREIRRVEALLTERSFPVPVRISTLFGDATPQHQRSALEPLKSGERKVILSTSIAETSLTIDGVRVVIDSGTARMSSFDAGRGMSGLVTVPVSRASADQRAGRAGRQALGVCYRLWHEDQQVNLPAFAPPEITVTDLAPLAMELAVWGDPEAKLLRFLDAPPFALFSSARSLLRMLEALDENGALTAHGRAMAALPVHPRFAHMLLRAKERSFGPLACDLAAMLDERDFFRRRDNSDIDLTARFREMLRNDPASRRWKSQSSRLRSLLAISERPGSISDDHLGSLLALAYPDRIGKRRSGDRYQLSGNMTASLPKGSALSHHEFLAVGDVDGAGSDIRIQIAEPVTEQEVRELFAAQIVTVRETVWDERTNAGVTKVSEKFGSIVLSESARPAAAEDAGPMVLAGIRSKGLDVLPWDETTHSLRSRSEWIRRKEIRKDWVDLSDETLLRTLEEWLAPFLTTVTKLSQLSSLSMSTILRTHFTHEQWKEIDRLAPLSMTVPTGSSIALDYTQDPPVLAVRLQEMFGETETPTIGGGKVRVLLHLLSPARRPLAVTQDLPSFWKNAYPQVRKDMRGEYPKHYWPEDPLQAEPTKRTKKAMDRDAARNA